MKQMFTFLNFNKIAFIAVCILMIISFKRINFYFFGSILIVFSAVYLKKRNFIKLSLPDLALFFVIIVEVIVYFNSSYKSNSYIFLRQLLIVGLMINVINNLFTERKYLIYFSIIISFIALFAVNIALKQFLTNYFETKYYGFKSFLPFRFLVSPMGFYNNEWGTILLSLIPFPAIAFLLLQKDTVNKENNKIALVTKIFLVITWLLLFISLITTFSRGIFISTLAYILLFIILYYVYRIKIKNFFIIKSLFLTAILFAFSFTLKNTMNENATKTLQRSSSGRIKQWSNTLSIAKDYPFFGIGSRNYPLISKVYIVENPDDMFTGRVNNSYIQILTEKGLLGLLSYLFLFIVLIRVSHKKIKSLQNDNVKLIHIIIICSVIAILVRELFFSSILYNPGLLLLILIMYVINTSNSTKIITVSKRYYSIFLFICLIVIAFCITKEFGFQKDKKHLECLTGLMDQNKYDDAYDYLNRIDINKLKNSLLLSTCGLVYERNAIDTLAEQVPSTDTHYQDSTLLQKSKDCYQRAINFNTYEDNFYHNIAWLYYYFGDIDSALINIDRAINLVSNSSLYYVTKGMFLEKSKSSQSFECYKEALKLSPDLIDAPFFNNLNQREIVNTDSLIQVAIKELHNYQNDNYSTIIQARIGKLLLCSGDTFAAKSVFEEVLSELPNLSRPWYYLGNINSMQNNKKEMLNCYNKSIFLNFDDYLPRKKMADYYWSINDSINATYFDKTALKYFNDKVTESSAKTNRIYQQSSSRNNLIPFSLFTKINQEL